MNKRIILPAMIILCVQFVIAQTQVQQRFDGVLLQESAEPAEETDVPAIPVTGADWLHLAELTGDSYLGQLELLLSDPSAAGDLQSFALAECLWFSCFEPESPVQQELFDKTAAAVRLFLDGINSGAVIPNSRAQGRTDVYCSIRKCTGYRFIPGGNRSPAAYRFHVPAVCGCNGSGKRRKCRFR